MTNPDYLKYDGRNPEPPYSSESEQTDVRAPGAIDQRDGFGMCAAPAAPSEKPQPTPRTDACQGSDGTVPECEELCEVARQLERELSSMTAARDYCLRTMTEAIEENTRLRDAAVSASGRSKWCSKCYKVITQPGIAYGINPDAICRCPR